MADPRIVGMCCEWAVHLWDDGRVDERGRLKDLPHVGVLKVPCSGMIKAGWAEMALKNGASGYFALGCPIGDCHFREGNLFCEERLEGTMAPKLKAATDKERVRTLYLAAGEYGPLVQALKDFTEFLRAKDAGGGTTPPQPSTTEATDGE